MHVNCTCFLFPDDNGVFYRKLEALKNLHTAEIFLFPYLFNGGVGDCCGSGELESATTQRRLCVRGE